MAAKAVMLACLLATAVCDMQYSFESLTHVHRYLHFRAGRLYTSKIYTNKGRVDSTFKLTPGLAEASDETVSFEAVSKPGYFVYEDVSGQIIMREKADGDRSFDDTRATFFVRKGNLFSGARPDYKSLESYHRQGNFLVEKDFRVRSVAPPARGMDIDFQRNSTFKLAAANWDGHASYIADGAAMDY